MTFTYQHKISCTDQRIADRSAAVDGHLKVKFHFSQIKHVSEAKIHPYFSAEQGSDVALLKLDTPLEFNEWVQVSRYLF